MEKICPIEYTLSLLSGKWKILILKELSQTALRYGAISRCIPGISSKVLVQQLRELEKDRLITREVFAEVPPRVEYALSERGKSIFTLFVELRRWALDSENVTVNCELCEKCRPYL